MHRSSGALDNYLSNGNDANLTLNLEREYLDVRERGLDTFNVNHRQKHNEKDFYIVGATREHRPHSDRRELILIAIDALGLALITACTLFEGYQTWMDSYIGNFQYNVTPLACWYAGRCAQTLGLIMLIIHYCGHSVGIFEAGGMYLLTIGPVINFFSAYFYHQSNDLTGMWNKKWMATEVTELLGIALLDVSCFDFADEHAFCKLIIELGGYYVVALAALLDFHFGDVANIASDIKTAYTYEMNDIMVSIIRLIPGAGTLMGVRWVFSFWRVLDAFGLFLLGVVAFEHYRDLQKTMKGKRNITEKYEH